MMMMIIIIIIIIFVYLFGCNWSDTVVTFFLEEKFVAEFRLL